MSDTGKPTPGPDPSLPLGIAGHTAQLFITSALTPLLFLSALVIGLIGLALTPREEDPQISVPMIDVFVEYPGASSRQVERLVTEPLERVLSEMTGVKHIYSATSHGRALVTVRFRVGEDLGTSLLKLYDRLESNWDQIPPGVAPPLVKPKSVNDVPIVTFTLWSKDLDDHSLRALALDVLQELKGVKLTGQGFLVGGRRSQVSVKVLPERLSGYGVTLDQVAKTIRGANSERRAGRAESQHGSFTIYTGGFLQSASDIGDLMVGQHRGRPVYVRDVAEIVQEPEETWSMVQHHSGPAAPLEATDADGEAAVTIAIAKKKDSNGVAVADALLTRMEQLKGQLIPANVEVEVSRNYGKTANDKVNELLLGLFQAAVAVSLLSWLFLGARPAIVVITVIPVVILVTVTSAWALGYSINRVSLFALVFAIGILVDDATVVVENIYRRWLEVGNTSVDVAVDAVREVGNPTIIATLAVLAALLPMGFVSGMMGPYMRPIPVLGSAAMIFSLIAAFIFTPWWARRIRPRFKALEDLEAHEARTREWVRRLYRPLMRPLCRRPGLAWAFLISIVVAFFLSCSMFYFGAVRVKMLPNDDKPELNVVISLPEGAALTATANLTSTLVQRVLEEPEVIGAQTYVGTSSPFNFNGMVRHYYLRQDPWHADIQVTLTDKGHRDRPSHDIATEMRERLTPIARAAGARIAVVEMPPGPPVLQTLVAEVYGPDAVTRRQVATDLTTLFEQTEGLGDVDNYLQAPMTVMRFEVDSQKAARRGISVDDINRNLEMALGGYKVTDVKQGNPLEPVWIVIQVPLAARAQMERLIDLPIASTDGTTIPLGELGRFRAIPEDPVIYHKDLRPMEYVVAEAVGEFAAPIYGILAVHAALEDYLTPDGITLSGEMLGPPPMNNQSAFEWTGEWTVTYETFRDMGLAFAAALVLIYILIVWEFDNLVLPLIVMTPIPLTLIGIVPGHWLLDAEFTATSMIGFIALAGILVRNTILLVDFARNAVDQGMAINEAVIHACETRMRPVVITDLTMMASAAALIGDPIFQGMAITLLFGPIAATTLTFIVIPLGCITAGKWLGTACRIDDDAPMPETGGKTCPFDSLSSREDNRKE